MKLPGFLKVLSVFLLTIGLVASGCVEKDETNNLAKAQECLDNVSQSNPTEATECLSYIEDYDSQQANILKCGIYMTSGGLIENKIVKAYEVMENSTVTNKEAAYMSILSLDKSTVTEGYTKALLADKFCQLTEVKGLMYLSGVIVAGTYLNKTIQTITGNAIDINDPSSINTAVNTMLAACTASPPTDAACTSDLATVGTVISSLASSYCASNSADKDVCSDINSAVDAAGGSSTNVGQALLCYMNNKTFNSSTGYCN